MAVEMSNTKRVLAVAAILATAIGVMADLAINPVIGVLYQTYPESMGYVNYFVSGPMLIVVIVSLLTGVALKKFNKRSVMIAGGIIFTVGAVCGVMVDNLLYMCVMRTLVGVGAGVVNVVAVALIADIYEDETKRAKITGYYNAAMSLVGMIFSYLAGILASGGDWQRVFNVYWSAIPMAVLLILFIPSVKPENQQADSQKKQGKKEPLGWRFWWMSFGWFVMNIVLGGTVLYYLSSYIMENGIGATELAGLSASVKSLAGFILCLGFGFVYGKLKRQTIVFCYLVAALSLIVLMFFPSVAVVLVVGTIGGCTYKYAFSYAYAQGFAIVPKSRLDESVSITTAVYGIGSFLSTYYATALTQLMGTEVFSQTWGISAGIMAALFVAEIVVSMIEKRKFTAEEN
ncbi:MAG: MFS transporter [Eubacterium sp.]|nr:MFS transporter [Eubacterium sp.]